MGKREGLLGLGVWGHSSRYRAWTERLHNGDVRAVLELWLAIRASSFLSNQNPIFKK
jgi:hypothetical protein